jgi:hypothetical protein
MRLTLRGKTVLFLDRLHGFRRYGKVCRACRVRDLPRVTTTGRRLKRPTAAGIKIRLPDNSVVRVRMEDIIAVRYYDEDVPLSEYMDKNMREESR